MVFLICTALQFILFVPFFIIWIIPFFVLTKINIMIYLGCVVEHKTSLGRACARSVGA